MPAWNPPDLEAVKALHERYLHEVVIQRNVCPFAQRSVDQRRVTRMWWTQPSEAHDTPSIARAFAQRVQDSDLEIVLLSFVLPPDDPHQTPAAFEDWHRSFRRTLEAIEVADRWYTVCFHPRTGEEQDDLRSTPARFVHYLRKTPDPVIQCVRVSTLEDVRNKAQTNAHKQLIESLAARDPALALMAQSCVMTDSQLSASIARKNHETWSQDPGWSELHATLESILLARRALDNRASCAKDPCSAG